MAATEHSPPGGLVLGEQACCSTNDDAAGRVLPVAIDLERHVVPHHHRQELVALGRAEQQGAAVHRVIDRRDVDFVDQSEGKSSELLLDAAVPSTPRMSAR